ncbi:MAG TPA: hypothetical protein VJC16_03580 [Candidatus Nanoarchaeia archaeon]|nr:hypothetical protein [Candidatus Nanoarchaeia archaeon]
MGAIEPLQGLIDPKVYRILQVFLANRERLYHLHSVSQEAKVPVSTTFRVVNRLLKLKLITIVPVGKMKLYRLAAGVQL